MSRRGGGRGGQFGSSGTGISPTRSRSSPGALNYNHRALNYNHRPWVQRHGHLTDSESFVPRSVSKRISIADTGRVGGGKRS